MLDDKSLKEILDAILASEWIKQRRLDRNVEEEIENFGYQMSKTEFELETLENFFYEDEETVYAVKPIWKYVKNRIESAVESVLTSPQKFILEGRQLRLGSFADDCLEDLKVSILDFYQRLLDDEWAGLTVDEASKRLTKGQQYVALLDSNGRLTREPIPLTRNLQAEIKGEITWDEEESLWGRVIRRRRLHIESNVPFKEGEPYRYKIIDLRKNEENFTIIKT
ncbi:MAG: hypothetical protein QXK93_04760 [Candidatus Bathyarchaeia archaeon]